MKRLIGSICHQYTILYTLNIIWVEFGKKATIYDNYFWSVHDICDNQGVYPIEYSDFVIDPIEKVNNRRYDSIHIINNFGQTPSI